jgi:hypothetical protein
MAHVADPNLLFSAFLRIARKQDEPIDWLEELQQAALIGTDTAVAAVIGKMQDPFAGSLSQEGSSSAFIREMSCSTIASMCEAALQVLEAEAAAEDAGMTGSHASSSRYSDFSGHECVLG